MTLEEALAFISRVRAFHPSDEADGFHPSFREGNERCIGCDQPYPCETIRVLDGEL